MQVCGIIFGGIMTDIPESHPRYQSLLTRELITQGVKNGITTQQGLIAQGRGEAFDYLIGEKTIDSAAHAETCACALLLLADNPVISVNGNAAALVPDGLVMLAEILGAKLEVNLFHRTDERVHRIVERLHEAGAADVLGETAEPYLPLDHERSRAEKEGIASADVVLVLLEDGDRCTALADMDKLVIAVDLNPLSRTARTAHVSIIDNIVRVIPNMIEIAKELKTMTPAEIWSYVEDYDNELVLADALEEIKEHIMTVQEDLLTENSDENNDDEDKGGSGQSDGPVLLTPEEEAAFEAEKKRLEDKKKVIMRGADLMMDRSCPSRRSVFLKRRHDPPVVTAFFISFRRRVFPLSRAVLRSFSVFLFCVPFL